MSLIDDDDPEVLKAEDEAIRDAENPAEPVAPDDIADLIERLTNGPTAATHDR